MLFGESLSFNFLPNYLVLSSHSSLNTKEIWSLLLWNSSTNSNCCLCRFGLFILFYMCLALFCLFINNIPTELFKLFIDNITVLNLFLQIKEFKQTDFACFNWSTRNI